MIYIKRTTPDGSEHLFTEFEKGKDINSVMEFEGVFQAIAYLFELEWEIDQINSQISFINSASHKAKKTGSNNPGNHSVLRKLNNKTK